MHTCVHLQLDKEGRVTSIEDVSIIMTTAAATTTTTTIIICTRYITIVLHHVYL
jgi:hypothetical protein